MTDSEKRLEEVKRAIKQMPAWIKEKKRRYRIKKRIRDKFFKPVVKQILEIQKESKK